MYRTHLLRSFNLDAQVKTIVLLFLLGSSGPGTSDATMRSTGASEGVASSAEATTQASVAAGLMTCREEGGSSRTRNSEMNGPKNVVTSRAEL